MRARTDEAIGAKARAGRSRPDRGLARDRKFSTLGSIDGRPPGPDRKSPPLTPCFAGSIEYGIPYSKSDRRHDPARPAPQPDRPGLRPDPRGDHRPYAAAGASHP